MIGEFRVVGEEVNEGEVKVVRMLNECEDFVIGIISRKCDLKGFIKKLNCYCK